MASRKSISPGDWQGLCRSIPSGSRDRIGGRNKGVLTAIDLVSFMMAGPQDLRDIHIILKVEGRVTSGKPSLRGEIR